MSTVREVAAVVRPWLRPAPLAALLVAVLAVLPALAVPGLVATRAGGDSPFLLERVFEMSRALAAGHIPPRWMPDGAFGLGYPFWNFYGPLVYLYAGLVALLGGGVVGAVKVATLGCFLAAAAGMFRFGEARWSTPGAGLVASAAYTLAPYHLVNLYVRGDALAELAAYGLFPWLLLAVDAARRRRSAGAVAVLALALAALVLSHNVSALLFLPVLVLAVLWPPAPNSGVGANSQPGPREAPGRSRRQATTLPPRPAAPLAAAPNLWTRPAAWVEAGLLAAEWRLWSRWRSLPGRWLLAVGAGLLLGLALSAWFWLPALAEKSQVHLADNTTGYFSYAGHFRSLDLLELRPVFDYRVDGEHQPWRTGLVQLALAAAGAFLAWRGRQRRRELWLWLVVAVGATGMITPLSGPLWQGVPLLAFAQFPWRWLAVQAFALAMLAGPVGEGGAWRRWLAVAFLLLSALPGLSVQTLAVDGVTPEDVAAFEVFGNNPGTTVRGEYFPLTVQPKPNSSAHVVYGRPGPQAVGGQVSGVLVRSGPATQEWQVDVSGEQSVTVAFPTLWFPGWTATVTSEPRRPPNLGAGPSGEPLPTPVPDTTRSGPADPVPAGVMPGSGWLSVEIAPGRHVVRLKLERSDARAVGEGISLLAALACLALLLVNRRRRWGASLLAVALFLMLSVAGARLLPVGKAQGPRTLDRSQSAWPRYNPAGLFFGAAHLGEASLAPSVVLAGEAVHVDLAWRVAPEGYRVEAALVSPAEPVFNAPDALDVAEADLREGEDSLSLTVPEEATAGLYFVRLRVYDGERQRIAQSADGWSPVARLRGRPLRFQLGDAYLGPVRVRGEEAAVNTATPVARMGDVSLLRVSTAQQGGLLRVDLTWQADRRPAAEYKTSLRLLDPEGSLVVQDDHLPLYGYFPSTAWPAAQPWQDRRWLPLPDDIEPGNGYALEVVLYTEVPAAELGSVRVPGVQVEAAGQGEESARD